jgi:anti-anti-sigma factor
MLVKIDTREKFHVITIHESEYAANMTEKMDKAVTELLDSNVKNVIINMKDIQNVDNAAAGHLVKLQQLFNERNASLVWCELKAEVKTMLDQSG